MKPRALMEAGGERSQGHPGAPEYQIQDPQLPLGGVGCGGDMAGEADSISQGKNLDTFTKAGW